MAVNFPTSIDSFSDPSGGDALNSPDHASQHTDHNSGIETLQAKVGIDSSAVTSSHDYKLSKVTGSDYALGRADTATVTNKTLTSPVINVGSDAEGDIYYRNGSGVFTRLALGTSSQILSVNSGATALEFVANPAASDASATVKGVVEEATQVEADARTAAGTTSARLYVNPSMIRGILYHDYAADAEANDTYVITVTPVPADYTTGDVYTFKANTVNTGTCTLNVNTLGAKTIKRVDGSTLEDGDIPAGSVIQVVYDGTDMILQTAPANQARYATGQGTRTTGEGTGNETIAHGLGVTPRLVKISFTYDHAGGTAGGNIGFGTATSTSDESCTLLIIEGTTPTFTAKQRNGYLVDTQDGASSTQWSATLSTLNSTNIIMNFNSASADSSLLYQWEAFA